MNSEDSKRIILNAVETTKSRWEEFSVHWSDIDAVFMRRGYETGGFECWKFASLLDNNGIFSINRLGSILTKYNGKTNYDRDFAGNLQGSFYVNMAQGIYGENGKMFFDCVSNFDGRKGAFFWKTLWQMLICCNRLMNNYNSSFSNFLRKKLGPVHIWGTKRLFAKLSLS